MVFKRFNRRTLNLTTWKSDKSEIEGVVNKTIQYENLKSLCTFRVTTRSFQVIFVRNAKTLVTSTTRKYESYGQNNDRLRKLHCD